MEKIGQSLIKAGLITEQQLEEALEEQKKSGGLLGEIVQNRYNLKSLSLYKQLADFYNKEFVNLLEYNIKKELLKYSDCADYSLYLFLPIDFIDNRYIVVTANPSKEIFSRIYKTWGNNTEIKVTSKFDILWTLQDVFNDAYLDKVTNSLHSTNIHLSSKDIFNKPQEIGIFSILLGILTAIYFFPFHTFLILNALLVLCISCIVFYRLLLSFVGLVITHEDNLSERLLDLKNLPIYTVLVPLFEEKEVILQHLTTAIKKIDYPVHKLDIKLILEENDIQTATILRGLNLPPHFEFIYAPYGVPQTKPRACNYALQFARGDYVTIYDAEDRPDPKQLKGALNVFAASDKNVICVQCFLSFYNSHDNWLTRMFTLEYCYWFDLWLPALAHYSLPIPLGGTSNHFKTVILKELLAWDAFNITEDADLGIRLFRLGYKTKVLHSTTFEEANCRLKNWIHQRTRWVRGYMQTYVVHMHQPVKLLRDLGFWGFMSFQLFVAGVFISNLSVIPFLITFIIFLLSGPDHVSYLFPTPIYQFAVINFFCGIFVSIGLNLIAVARRRWYDMLIYAFSAPLYWILMSAASYRALYQLLMKPTFWEKTEHGLSKFFDKTSENKNDTP